jgi:hypothetical protein
LNTHSFAPSEKIFVYPNPSQGIFRFDFHLESPADIKLNVFDLAGRNVFSQVFENGGNKKFDVDLRNLPMGIYEARLENSDGVIIKKLVISDKKVRIEWVRSPNSNFNFGSTSIAM